ncbi:hypothetical protein [Streptomyces sp. NBC_01465]|uniref:hypothetical protein n=1 Tax=Streptomyces sp. NBC_01465 TaxID=2903878 RepID=UPI002E2EBB92|nr:hypothetical protein [Streptomyces sp. NBC_01465]
MSAQDVVTVAVAVLVPVVTAATGILSLVLQDRRQRRSRRGRRRLAYEDASRQVSFAAEWWAAQQSLPAAPETLSAGQSQAQAWLDQASERVNEAGRQDADDEPQVTFARLLLLYGMQSRQAKIVRLGFYAGLVAMACWSLVLISEVSAHGSRDAVTGETVTMLLIAVALLLLRFWAVSADAATDHVHGGG